MAEARSMTGFSLERFPFAADDVKLWGEADPRHRNWPVVYVMNNDREVYIGESLNVEGRMRQHLDSDEKRRLNWVRVVLDQRFNKSACLDLESFLIRMFSGDGRLQVLNHNAGITDADYYDRSTYQQTFDDVFETLRTQEHLFQRTLPEIINSDLFKLSPFKALNHDQAIAVEDILEGLFADLEDDKPSISIVQGNPGTGKTVVAIYLLKLLEDIKRHDPEEPLDSESIFSDFFTPGHAELLASLRVGIVVPQQSLRESISRVFKLTPGLSKNLVLTPFEVGESAEPFDLLLVDEAHRLNQRANQASGPLNKKFADINRSLFGEDRPELTQLDWIRKQSTHTILMIDTGQSVRPADLPTHTTKALLDEASASGRHYPLRSQMRITAERDYVGYARSVLSDAPPLAREHFDGYDLRFFTDLSEMRDEIFAREREHGLSRLVAGYAWEWRSRHDPNAFDIEIGQERFRWNSTQRDWINSPKSVQEVGSIHTVQGYDLNYAGVIIGKDLRYEPRTGKLYFDRSRYYDKKGRENNPKLGIIYSDDDILEYIRNIYVVLLTRGIQGTYVYVEDEHLREHLSGYFS
ncbi:DNA/RNA helicase domain-containing protein [Plantibacter sp. Mn2098]|uniref:DNA/RNA helicase domain-containing protein n=1 Tax=Plantibacter sp. Mn2098 TaxID=3395266 RepID=UPI003BD74623